MHNVGTPECTVFESLQNRRATGYVLPGAHWYTGKIAEARMQSI